MPLRDGAYDLDAMAGRIGPRTRIVYVCNPNNPTGTMVGRERLRAFLDRVPEDVLVVVDEAYHEYVTDPDYPDAIVEHVRAPERGRRCARSRRSTAWPGCGSATWSARRRVVREAMKVRDPFDVSELAHVAALASLDDRPSSPAGGI